MSYKDLILLILDAAMPFLPLQFKIFALALRAIVAKLAALDAPVGLMAAPDAVHAAVTAAFDQLVAALADRPVLATLAGLLGKLVQNRLMDKVWDKLVEAGILGAGAAMPLAAADASFDEAANEAAFADACAQAA